MKTVQVEIPVYETRRVKVGLRGVKVEEPYYETRRVQVGVREVKKQEPVYKTQRVKTGTRMVKKEILVTRYKTVTRQEWKRFTYQVPVYQMIGSKRFLEGYKTETSWKRVPVTERVPYQDIKIITVEEPVYEEQKVLTGYRTVTEQVPVYEEKKILAGYRTVEKTEPVFEEQQVQVGTRTETRQVPVYQTVNVLVGSAEAAQYPPENPDTRDLEHLTPPAGLSHNAWDSLDGKDQQETIDGSSAQAEEDQDGWGMRLLKAYLRNIVAPLLALKEHPDEVLKGVDPDKLPKFFSVSANASWDLNLLTQEGAVLSQSSPPGLWQLFYMQQKLNIEPKSVVTVNPGSWLDFQFTSGSGSVKLTDKLSYIFGPGEWGYSIKQDSYNPGFDYSSEKHSLSISLQGITNKYKVEDVFISSNESNDKYQVRIVSTAECETKTIKFEGILLAAIVTGVCIESVLPLFGTNLIFDFLMELG